MKQNTIPSKINASYEQYRELAGEICDPIDDTGMTHDLRYELYTSKLTYLYNIQEQFFRYINTGHCNDAYTIEDLVLIQKAIEITKEFLRQTIHEALSVSIKIAEKKALHASKYQFNS